MPRKLKYELPTHEVWTVSERGWAGTKNGALLALATANAFELFITVDQGLFYH
ncbi:MAG: hypothetical protein H0T73_06805 [Ardenticatenales bacterium]|nr:hypothetical protein [Ardenticatenales bacterium]